MERFDVAVIGAGAAGLFCAALAGQRGSRVVLIDHAARIGEKIRISGGGRCNFTNLSADDHRRYLSNAPRFARRALKAFPPSAFIGLLARHRIGWHEKHRGQLFCDDGSQTIVDMLVRECDAGRVTRRHPVSVRDVRLLDADGLARRRAGFVVDTDAGPFSARHLVVATGGLSIPAIGATDFAFALARRFGIAVVEPRPGLVPFTADPVFRARFAALSGLSLPVRLRVDGVERIAFDEDLLFTHRGVSGPAALQVSSYWRAGERLRIDFAPGEDVGDALLHAAGPASVSTRLSQRLPRRLAAALLGSVDDGDRIGPLPPVEVANASLRLVAERVHRWSFVPAGTEGFRKAEVTCGGIDTAELDPGTMEASRVGGLHFIGEAVDVTGWLGGYNFQWAWSSAHAAACAIGGQA
ncbi:MAG: NAD(P)/FAD-dependent oxidoreductase [Lautropia sp.]